MSLTEKQRAELVTEYCHLCPDVATKTLARRIYEQHEDSFKHVEQIRYLIRYRRGQCGKAARKKVAGSELVQGSGDDRRRTGDMLNPFVAADAKILVFDIETAPMLAHVWGCFKQYINPEQLLESSKVLCYAAKWLGEDTVYFDSIKADMPSKKNLKTVFDFYHTSDKRVCGTLRDLFNEADIVVAHNGRAFDVKTMNARWLKHGYAPPDPYKVFDTLDAAKKQFRFPRNKLESIGRFLELGKKTEHEGFTLWTKCMSKDTEAWKRMEEYNIQDVLLLEDVYLTLRPWASRHPNVGMLSEDNALRCVICGSPSLKPIAKKSRTMVNSFDSYRCRACGKVMRSGKADKRPAHTDVLRHSL